MKTSIEFLAEKVLEDFDVDVEVNWKLLYYLQNLYDNNREKINDFLNKQLVNKMVDWEIRALLICACVTIISGLEKKIVITEYMKMSDIFDVDSSIINAVMDKFEITLSPTIETL